MRVIISLIFLGFSFLFKFLAQFSQRKRAALFLVPPLIYNGYMIW